MSNPKEPKVIGELPMGVWQLTSFDGGILAASPDHPPHVIADGQVKPLIFSPPEFDGDNVVSITRRPS